MVGKVRILNMNKAKTLKKSTCKNIKRKGINKSIYN